MEYIVQKNKYGRVFTCACGHAIIHLNVPAEANDKDSKRNILQIEKRRAYSDNVQRVGQIAGK